MALVAMSSEQRTDVRLVKGDANVARLVLGSSDWNPYLGRAHEQKKESNGKILGRSHGRMPGGRDGGWESFTYGPIVSAQRSKCSLRPTEKSYSLSVRTLVIAEQPGPPVAGSRSLFDLDYLAHLC